jgi:hypothetical protein
MFIKMITLTSIIELSILTNLLLDDITSNFKTTMFLKDIDQGIIF